jgi:hypothetical protein
MFPLQHGMNAGCEKCREIAGFENSGQTARWHCMSEMQNTYLRAAWPKAQLAVFKNSLAQSGQDVESGTNSCEMGTKTCRLSRLMLTSVSSPRSLQGPRAHLGSEVHDRINLLTLQNVGDKIQ